MKAAVITSIDQPPHYREWADPAPSRPHEMLVDVLAAGLHHVTRTGASGAHYAHAGGLPLIPGVDGVGVGTDGKLRYFVQGPGQAGSMAEKTVIELQRSIELPLDCDPVVIAGAMNPAMASWLALRCRIAFQRGQRVLVLGATGSSGSMAVQIARHLGASQVVAAGRNTGKLAKLPTLGATDVVNLENAAQLGAAARKVDVVLDFVWGSVAPPILRALLEQRTDRNQPLTWVHVGSMAGDVAAIPGALLRAANVQIVGSGYGSVPARAILMELPALAQEITQGSLRIAVKATPLCNVAQAWSETAQGGERIVFTP